MSARIATENGIYGPQSVEVDAPLRGMMNKRIEHLQTINTAVGEKVIVRTGTIIGDSDAGMFRVEWDADELGHMGWVAQGTFEVVA